MNPSRHMKRGGLDLDDQEAARAMGALGSPFTRTEVAT